MTISRQSENAEKIPQKVVKKASVRTQNKKNDASNVDAYNNSPGRGLTWATSPVYWVMMDMFYEEDAHDGSRAPALLHIHYHPSRNE